jgi:hypothetical protein
MDNAVGVGTWVHRTCLNTWCSYAAGLLWIVVSKGNFERVQYGAARADFLSFSQELSFSWFILTRV